MALVVALWGCGGDSDAESSASRATDTGPSADVTPQPDASGALGGPCLPDGTCAADLECAAGRCVTPGAAPGALGGPCGPAGACDGNLECREGLCRETAGEAPSDSGERSSEPGERSSESTPPVSVGPPPDGFVTIPAGTFTMGSPEDEEGRTDDEVQVSVTLTRAFHLQETAVTQRQYEALMGEVPRDFPECDPDCPVVHVTWHDAVAYANALSQAEDLPPCYNRSGEVVGGVTAYDCEGYRLPSEAEWEYAARAGTETATYNGDLPGISCEESLPVLDPIAWYQCNSAPGDRSERHPVGLKQPNGWGLYDMLGNVQEWTGSWYQWSQTGGVDPVGLDRGERRVVRGGSYRVSTVGRADNARAARRSRAEPDSGASYRGFRVARSDCRAGVCRGPEEASSTGPPLPAEFVEIPAGTFTMGSPEEERGRRWNREAQISVTLTRAFHLQTTPVTQAQFAERMGENPSRFEECGADCPVESMSWYDAIAYANAVSIAEGLPECYDAEGNVIGGDTVYDCAGYRLPTEFEWEYAARAGTTTATWAGDLPGETCALSLPLLDAIAWYRCNSATTERRMTRPVGMKTPNPWGLYDMLGNVEEWTDTWFERSPAGGADPVGPATGSGRVLRGGSSYTEQGSVRAASRSEDDPDFGSEDIGFRLARTAEP